MQTVTFKDNLHKSLMQIVTFRDNLHEMSTPIFRKQIFHNVVCWKFFQHATNYTFIHWFVPVTHNSLPERLWISFLSDTIAL